jgi:hypothetical protein
MKTVFIDSITGQTVTERDESLNLHCGQKVIIGEDNWQVFADAITDLNMNQIEVFILKSPYSDK